MAFLDFGVRGYIVRELLQAAHHRFCVRCFKLLEDSPNLEVETRMAVVPHRTGD
jgi:hypothetical protein